MDFDVDSFALSLDADGQAFAASQINSGGVLRIIATPADTVVQATYAGEGIFFGDPPLPPVLNVTVSTGGVIEVLKGDVDTDGDVDFGDIPAFIGVLQSGVFQAEADVDCSGGIDFSDIPAFIQVLQGQ